MPEDTFDEEAEIAETLERETDDGPGTDDFDSLPEPDAEFDAEEDLR